MALYITRAQVFDPALSDQAYMPARIEIHVVGLPDKPTYTDLGNTFSVFHYSWLQRIYSELWDWSETDNASNAAIYNSSAVTENTEPVMPVTVIDTQAEDGAAGFGEEYFIKISRAKRILRNIERTQGHRGYELLPDPLYAEEKKNAWYLQHPNRQCVHCVVEASEASPASAELQLREIPDMCKLFKVRPYRLVALCKRHSAFLNEERKAERLFAQDDGEVVDK